MSIDRFGRIVWQTDTAATDPVSVTVRVTDEGGKFAEQSFEINFVADTEAPAVEVFRSLSDFSLQTGGQLDIGSTSLIRVIASDNVAVESLSLEVNGTVVALDALGQFRFDAVALGAAVFTATATDAAGNVGEGTMTILVVDPASTSTPINPGSGVVPTDPTLPPHPGFDPSDTGLPIVEITAPEQLTSVTNVVAVEGTVDDPEDNLWYYRCLLYTSDAADE